MLYAEFFAYNIDYILKFPISTYYYIGNNLF